VLMAAAALVLRQLLDPVVGNRRHSGSRVGDVTFPLRLLRPPGQAPIAEVHRIMALSNGPFL
jgi:hypothetical protein